MADFKRFAETAKGLSRNPLGIIALFIVLIYGFAALTLGTNSALQPGERSLLVWFMVLFPVVVLTNFAWLVSRHHEKLYAPADFHSDDAFLQGLEVRRRQAVEIRDQLGQLKERVKEVLVASNPQASKDGRYRQLIEKISSDIDRSTSVAVDLRAFVGNQSAVYLLPVAAYETLNDLIDEVFFKMNNKVPPFDYGHSWVMRNCQTGEVIKNARMITRSPRGSRVMDSRSLAEAGIVPGTVLAVEALRPTDRTLGR